MLVKLHANAATTPKMRAYIQTSGQPAATLARQFGISETTVRRWRQRREVADRSSTPHTLATGFAAEEEEIAVELRTRLALSLDDILEVLRRCLRPDISRSALHRCLKCRGVSQTPRDPKPLAQRFGAEFTDRFGDARWRRRDRGTGAHPFDLVCVRHRVRHKLTRPYRPQTNGMAERFNRRLAEALDSQPSCVTNAGKNRFRDHAQRTAFIQTFVNNYNRTRLRCLGHQAPAELLANLPGHNTQAGTTT